MPNTAPQRSDALKYREAIPQVAHDALTESPDASLNPTVKCSYGRPEGVVGVLTCGGAIGVDRPDGPGWG